MARQSVGTSSCFVSSPIQLVGCGRPDLAEVHAVTDISDSLVVLHDGAVVFDGAPADIETVLRSHVYEVAAGLDAATLAKALTPLQGVEFKATEAPA